MDEDQQEKEGDEDEKDDDEDKWTNVEGRSNDESDNHDPQFEEGLVDVSDSEVLVNNGGEAISSIDFDQSLVEIIMKHKRKNQRLMSVYEQTAVSEDEEIQE